jgi:hypothetical protein
MTWRAPSISPYIWDNRSKSIDPVQSIVAWKDSVTSLVVSGHKITGGSVDGTVATLDIRAGRLKRDELGHPVGRCRLNR